jgi:tetratricopeptide (TPR) repeat protein
MVLREWPETATKVLATIFVFNLFLPARHVVAGWPVSPAIHCLPIEIARFWHPPADFFQYYLDRGNTLADEGRYLEAIKEFEQATRINPDSTDAWVLLGLCHMRLNQLKSAVSDFSAAIRLDPEDPYSRYKRGLARRSGGDLKGALDDLRMALKWTPKSSPQRPRIESALEEALSRAPESAGKAK